MRDWEDIKAEVVQRLDMRTVAELCGVKVRREGVAWKGTCPFHVEKSASFHMGGREGMQHRGHCFGCGWDGDIFSFWGELKGCDFKGALSDLAAHAGVPMGDGVEWAKPAAPRARQAERRPASERPTCEKPSLPSLRHLRREECAQVALARGLDAEAVWVAAREYKRMAFTMWPLYQGADKLWHPRSVGVFPSWCAIDGTRNVAEYRRLDNGLYPRQDGGTIKSWSTAGKAWPLGAAHLDGKPAVMLVEGGPDMLAAYHFLRRYNMLGRVGVVCMLGASNRMREDALPFFRGKRVRIMVDADPLKDGPGEPVSGEQSAVDEEAEACGGCVEAPVVHGHSGCCAHSGANKWAPTQQGPTMGRRVKKRSLPGIEAAARWGKQLSEAGAVVETFCVGAVYGRESLRAWSRGEIPSAEVAVITEGLRLPDGTLVKDLNDLAKCGPEVLGQDDVRAAFRCWDF